MEAGHRPGDEHMIPGVRSYRTNDVWVQWGWRSTAAKFGEFTQERALE